MYYKNTKTNETSYDKDQANTWIEEGIDVEVWDYSETLCEWVCRMIMCGKEN